MFRTLSMRKKKIFFALPYRWVAESGGESGGEARAGGEGAVHRAAGEADGQG